MPKKVKGKQLKIAKPAYFSKKKLTVGMLEDLCRSIKDKTATVIVADKHGSSPATAKVGMVMHRNGRPTGLLLCGDWVWAINGDEDIDEEEDEIVMGPLDGYGEWDSDNDATGYGHLCPLIEPGDCIKVDGAMLQYLPSGVESDSTSESAPNDKQA